MVATPRIYSLCILCAIFFRSVAATEQVFVDVFSNESFNIRTLDVAVSTVRGAANFFTADPMDAHDWTSVKRLVITMNAELAASNSGTGVAADRIRGIEQTLSPLYQALPKNEHGRLSNGTIRYALHRYFVGKHGWSLKGLEPAAQSWVHSLSVTPDVRQTSKYIVPTYIHSLLLVESGGQGLDLRLLAVLAASIEHLVRSEMLQTLQNVLTTLGLRSAGKKTDKETESILTTFLMSYAFGTNLEFSDLEDVTKARAYLDMHHEGWRGMGELIRSAWKDIADAEAPDFTMLVKIATEITERYGQWQSRGCIRARDALAAAPGSSDGSVPLESMPGQMSDSRMLFSESHEELQNMGVLHTPEPGKTHLVVPNYLSAHSMCLTTASYYAVCCMDACEPILRLVELGVAAPLAAPARVFELLSSVSADAAPETFTLATLEAIAKEGSIALHGKPFAEWLHRVFPSQCPLPAMALTNPRTADEWMADGGTTIEGLETVMSEISATIARYAAMGSTADDKAAAEEERPTSLTNEDIIVILAPERLAADSLVLRGGGRSTVCRLLANAVLMLSMVGFAIAAARSGLATFASPAGDTKKRVRGIDDYA